MKTWIERLDIILSILILMDIILLISSFLYQFDTLYIDYVLIFDTILCIILICTFAFKIANSDNRALYFRKNYLDLLASIPLEFLMLVFTSLDIHFLNILILLRILRLILLFKESFKYARKFFHATSMDKVFALFIVVVIVSTFSLYYFDPSMPGLYESMWFVFQTITTVGYGDVIPESNVGQFIGMVLLVVGVFLFSIVTASFAYMFNEKVFKEENQYFTDRLNHIKENVRQSNDSIAEIREKSLSTEADLSEIREKLDKTDENIKDINSKIDYLIEIIEKK